MTNIRSITAAVILSLICVLPSFSQTNNYTFFKKSHIYKPFVSEIRSTMNKLENGFLNSLGPDYYLDDESSRPFTEVCLGYSIPVFSMKKNLFSNSTRYGIDLSLPVGSRCLVDMFEKTTAPVINCDYWFGIEINGIMYTPRLHSAGIKNIAARLVPVYHESTHIGDELALHGYLLIDDFKRINLSYEAFEIGLTINDPDTLSGNIVSFRTGFIGIWNRDQGYYSYDSLEVKGQEISDAGHKPEYYFLLNWQRSEGFLCSEKCMNILSAEVRNRTRFGYEPGVTEKRVWCINGYIGWRHALPGSVFDHAGLFLRYYQGVNPYGQFRNRDGFRYIGLSIVVGG